MLQDSLSDELLAVLAGQEVLGVLLQDDDGPVVCLHLSVVLHTPDRDVERLGRMVVGHEVDTGTVADGPHVRGQVSVVLGEEVLLGLAQVGLDVGR